MSGRTLQKGFLVWMTLVLAACNNDGKMNGKLDSLSKKIDSSAERLMDTAKKDLKNLKEDIQDKLSKKDSTKK